MKYKILIVSNMQVIKFWPSTLRGDSSYFKMGPLARHLGIFITKSL